MIKASPRNRVDKNVWKNKNKNKNWNYHCKAIADITPPHYFGTSVSMVTPFWILSTRQKLPHTALNIPTMFHEVWWKKSIFFKSPFFNFHDNCDKVWPADSDLFGLSRSTRCGCDRKHYCKNCWSLETFFAPWLLWQRPPFWKIVNHQLLPHTTVDIPTKFDEVWWKESKTN